jgi:hypothetical protein
VFDVQWEFETEGDDVFKEAVRHQLERVRRQLQNLWCPVHGERPTIIVRGHTPDDIAADVKGCCENLDRLARERLTSMGFAKNG